jgi:hypothetical protein
MIGETHRHPEWRIVVDLFRAAEYGQVLTHEALCAATGLRAESRAYYQQMSQARKVLLRDHSIAVNVEPKVGYRRAEPERYAELGKRQFRLGKGRIREGRKTVNAAPVTMLNDQQLRELEHIQRQICLAEQAVKQAVKSMRNVLPPVQSRLTDGSIN